jgi:5'(3')-deoxyribonucleotidase
MTDKLHIAIDMDDCLCDFSGMLREAVWDEFAISIPEFDAWEISHVLDPIMGKEWLNGWLRERPRVWAGAHRVPGAFGALAQLRTQGHLLEIVTKKPRWAEELTWEWVARNLPPVTKLTIIDLTDRKSQATDADLLIDDNTSHCEEFIEDGRAAILLTRPHNIGDNVPFGVHRADSWDTIVKLIEEEASIGLA